MYIFMHYVYYRQRNIIKKNMFSKYNVKLNYDVLKRKEVSLKLF